MPSDFLMLFRCCTVVSSESCSGASNGFCGRFEVGVEEGSANGLSIASDESYNDGAYSEPSCVMLLGTSGCKSATDTGDTERSIEEAMEEVEEKRRRAMMTQGCERLSITFSSGEAQGSIGLDTLRQTTFAVTVLV